MSDQKLRIGVIGIGWYAGTALIPRLRETGRAEIVAIARRNTDRLAQAQQELKVGEAYTDWREMLDKSQLDAVVISTPPNAHTEPALAALERGLHVFVEKPIALTPADAQRMGAAAAEADRTLMVGYNARGMGSWRTIRRLLSEDAIGSLRQVSVTACMDLRFIWRGMALPEETQNVFASSAYYGDVFGRGNWRTLPDIVGGGMFADVGSHIQDIALWLANGAPTQVAGFAQSQASPAILSALAHLDNGVLLSLAFNDAVSGGETLRPFYSRGRMTFYGDRGQLTADWTKIMSTEAEEIWLEQEGVRTQVEPAFESVHPATVFVSTVLDGAPNLCPAHEAARTVALTEAIYRSEAEGRIVRV
ncbi:MAG: Gfo/Idh/MocA family oxidoreductase [Chloroflexi bacterium]|nr:Gfo/Idh/MocA family oxidoreductase [Chloroflexota bacterium]